VIPTSSQHGKNVSGVISGSRNIHARTFLAAVPMLADLCDSKRAVNSAMTGKQTWTKVHELLDCPIYILNRMVTSILNEDFHLLG
jgi:hypothetical protein